MFTTVCWNHFREIIKTVIRNEEEDFGCRFSKYLFFSPIPYCATLNSHLSPRQGGLFFTLYGIDNDTAAAGRPSGTVFLTCASVAGPNVAILLRLVCVFFLEKTNKIRRILKIYIHMKYNVKYHQHGNIMISQQQPTQSVSFNVASASGRCNLRMQ